MASPPPDAENAFLRECLQRIATGPEMSKDLDRAEAHRAMRFILSGRADAVQAGVFLIALRMKRETEAENAGVLDAIIDSTLSAEAAVDDLLTLAEPYNGFVRCLPAAPFLPPVLAALGVPTIVHGVETVGPKFGVTHCKVLRAAGADVGLGPEEAARRVESPETGWAYVDQARFNPPLHALTELRERIVKRPCLTTVEVLVRPVTGRRDHLVTGYVHKAYPPVYTALARRAGYASAAVVRGVEGGIVPSLQQVSRLFRYVDGGPDERLRLDPAALGIEQPVRAVPIPAAAAPGPDAGGESAFDADVVAAATARAGRAALSGARGPMRDSLIYAGGLCLVHLGRAGDLAAAGREVARVIDGGAALERLDR